MKITVRELKHLIREATGKKMTKREADHLSALANRAQHDVHRGMFSRGIEAGPDMRKAPARAEALARMQRAADAFTAAAAAQREVGNAAKAEKDADMAEFWLLQVEQEQDDVTSKTLDRTSRLAHKQGRTPDDFLAIADLEDKAAQHHERAGRQRAAAEHRESAEAARGNAARARAGLSTTEV